MRIETKLPFLVSRSHLNTPDIINFLEKTQNRINIFKQYRINLLKEKKNFLLVLKNSAFVDGRLLNRDNVCYLPAFTQDTECD